LEELDRELYRVLARPQRDGTLGLDLEGFLALSAPGQRRVLLYALEKIKAPRFAADHIETIRELAGGPYGKMVHLPGGFWAARDYDALVLGKGGEKSFQARELPVPGMVAIGDLWIKADLIPRERASVGSLGKELGESCAEFDWEAIVPPLVVRPRAVGDRMEPFGLGGSKKVKDIACGRWSPSSPMQKGSFGSGACGARSGDGSPRERGRCSGSRSRVWNSWASGLEGRFFAPEPILLIAV
jgi:tRNA(Ile)-lysidine synthase